MVGRTPRSAADALVGLLTPCMMPTSLFGRPDGGGRRGPGGPPHRRSTRQHWANTGALRAPARGPPDEAVDLPPARQGTPSRRRDLFERRPRTVPPHGGRGALAGSGPAPLRRHGGELGRVEAPVEALPHRSGAGDADA